MGSLFHFIHFLSCLIFINYFIFRLIHLSKWARFLFAHIILMSFIFILIFFSLRFNLWFENYQKCQKICYHLDFDYYQLLVFIEFWLFPFILCFRNPMYFKDFEVIFLLIANPIKYLHFDQKANPLFFIFKETI